MRRIVLDYGVGQVVRDREPEGLARQVHEMLSSAAKREEWQQNLHVAAHQLTWENEAEKLRDVYRGAGLTFPATHRFPG